MWVEELNDTQTGMLLGIPRSARCVQRFDDSLNSAIHITYRISLRSSSMREPRDPLLKVLGMLKQNRWRGGQRQTSHPQAGFGVLTGKCIPALLPVHGRPALLSWGGGAGQVALRARGSNMVRYTVWVL